MRTKGRIMFISKETGGSGRHLRRDGFTLLEVLIAISILTVGILSAGQMQIMAIRGNGISGTSTEALNLAQQQLERLINTDYYDASVADTTMLNNGDLTSTATIEHQRNVDQYTIIWNISDDDPIPDTKSVVVIVTWENGRHARILRNIKSLAS